MADPGPTFPEINPDSDEAREALDLYAIAVGRVAYSWNRLHEAMAKVFGRIVGGQSADPAEGMLRMNLTEAVWHSSFNDRLQRQMLGAAIRAARLARIIQRGAVRSGDTAGRGVIFRGVGDAVIGV